MANHLTLTNNSSFPNWITPSLILFFAIVATYFAGLTPSDDGLRHIAFAAFNDTMHSWGEVYPHSFFQTTYDPWFAWHHSIRLLLNVIPFEYIHMAINVVILTLLTILIRAHLTQCIKPQRHFFLTLFSILIAAASTRYLNCRPDNLSGLYLLACLLQPGSPRLQFFLTILYAPFYYLFFLHTALLAATWFSLRRYTAAMAIIGATAVGLLLHTTIGGMDYWQIINYVAHDNTLREGLFIIELQPLFDFIPQAQTLRLGIPLAIVCMILIRITPRLQETRVSFVLLSAALWLQHLRYYGLFFPLICIVLLKTIIEFTTSIRFSNLLTRWRAYCLDTFTQLDGMRCSGIILIAIASFSIAYQMRSLDKIDVLNQARLFQNKRYQNATLLFNGLTLETFHSIYVNPTLHIIPSCSLGWFDGQPKMREMYHDLIQHSALPAQDLLEFMHYLNADYYVHTFETEKIPSDDPKLNGFKLVEKVGHTYIYQPCRNDDSLCLTQPS